MAIEKLQAAQATTLHRCARQGRHPGQGIVREPIHLIALLDPLHRMGAATDTTGMPEKKEAAMRAEKGVIRARPAIAFRALVHVGPQQFFEPRPMHPNQALPAFVTGQGGGCGLSKVTPNLTPSRHLPDKIHRIARINRLSFDPNENMKEKSYK